jgi:aryl-alcohol dehydrogenase-like predicted oxidoreductase
MKLVIGTANFYQKYGITNKYKIFKTDLKKIIKFIINNKIIFLDTAQSYFGSERIIGDSKLKKFNLITKISFQKKDYTNINLSIKKKILSSLKKLRTKSIFGLLIHDSSILFSKKRAIILNELDNYKRKGLIQNIGISVYEPKEIKKIWSFWKPDIIQVPYNILDQRFEKTGWLKKFKMSGTKIFVRSCFLQGILISDDYNKLKIKSSLIKLKQFKLWCRNNNLSRVESCINFIKNNKYIDFLVVGFFNYKQLQEIFKIFNRKKNIRITKRFSSNNLNLIDPRKWQI